MDLSTQRERKWRRARGRNIQHREKEVPPSLLQGMEQPPLIESLWADGFSKHCADKSENLAVK